MNIRSAINPPVPLYDIHEVARYLGQIAGTGFALPLSGIHLYPMEMTSPVSGGGAPHQGSGCRNSDPIRIALRGYHPATRQTDIIGWVEWKSLPSSVEQEAYVHMCESWYLRYWVAGLSCKLNWEPVQLFGESPAFLETIDHLLRASKTNLPVLITGKTGTGKELFARSIHLLSHYRTKKFITYNCGHLIGDTRALSTLFGHKKGSYTGAAQQREGLFRAARGGTLFLDEVEVLSSQVQSMLLRAVETGEIYPLGEDTREKVDVHLVAATNQNLPELLKRGRFREDLYFRLRGSQIFLPTLKSRGEVDIRHLTRAFIRLSGAASGKTHSIEHEVFRYLQMYDWPGNVRELQQVIRYACAVCDSRITLDTIATQLQDSHTRPSARDSIPGPPGGPSELLHRITVAGENFWDVIYRPYMNRDLNRKEVQSVLRVALSQVDPGYGAFKRVTELLNIRADEYRRFMDWMRKHRLAP